MLGQPSLRRRLIVSYLVVVLAVTTAAFVTVQVLVPQFFEQAVQQRLGPGPQDGQNQQQGRDESPGLNQNGQQSTPTDAPNPPGTVSTTTSAPNPPTSTPTPTGSTVGPGEPNPDPGNGDGQPGGNPDPGSGQSRNSTTTTVEAAGGFAPGIVAAAPIAQEIERNPVPAEIQEEYDRALTGALIIATLIGLVIALALGWPLTRRLLRTFTGIKEGASRLADGNYSVRVPVPPEIELADLAESVNTLADSLERTEQTRARLVSDLAHEIRNPLSTIEGYMEGLIDGVLPPSRETYEAVANEAHRLKRLTWDLSTLSKAQEGAIEFDFVTADLAAIVDRVADTLRPQYELNQVGLVVDVSRPLPIRADIDRIAQTLTNLLGNALGHTPPGGKVLVTGAASERWCSVAVVDSGEGIPGAQLETIFERFIRLDSSHAGTGIGLSIARTLARAHGGDIVASSAGAGTGATFELTLPRVVSAGSAKH